ncbi:MAG: sugar (and other) transporter family protein [Firmicutes bacterium]|nr:sugar (and other) transporter family protein [Bacillota bacterium]
MKLQPLWTRNYILSCISYFFISMPYFIFLTTLPVFVRDVLKGDTQETGLVISIFMVSSILLRPLIGKWVDVFDKRLILLISLGLYWVFGSMYVAASSVSFLIVLRFFHGIGFGMSTNTIATITGILVPPQRKGEGIGYFSMFMSVASVCGPFLGLSVITHYNFSILFIICAGFSLISFLCGLMMKFPPLFSNTSKQVNKDKGFSWKNYIEPNTILIGLAACLSSFSFIGIFTFIVLYAREIGIEEFASYFFVIYSLAVIIPRPVVGRLFDRLGPNIIVYPAIAIFTGGLILLSQTSTVISLLFSGFLLGLGNGILLSVFQTLAITSAPKGRTGVATSTFFIFFDGGIGAGAFCLGLVASYTNYQIMYLFSAIVMLFAAGIYYCFDQQRKRTGQRSIMESM